MSDEWMRNLGFNLSSEWRVSLTTRAPFGHNYVAILISRMRGSYTLMGAVMPPDVLLNAYHNRPLTLPEGHVCEAQLPEEIGRTLEMSLREVGVFTLADKPLTGTDGLTISVESASETDVHRFQAWSPQGHHRDVLQFLIGPAGWPLAGFSSFDKLLGVEPIKRWLERSYKEPNPPRPFRPCSGEIALTHEDWDASRSWSIRIDESGVCRADGPNLAMREWALGQGIRDRILHAVDVDRLMSIRGERIGVGDYAIELSVGARSRAVSVGSLHSGDPDFSSLPHAVGENIRVLRRLFYAMQSGRTEPLNLPDLPRPVRTEGLLLRFRTHNPRVWWSIFNDGVGQAFVDADAEVAGSALCPRLVDPVTMDKLRELVGGLDVRVVDIRQGGEHDSEVILQRVVDSHLVSGRYAWTPAYNPLPAHFEAFRTGEYERVSAICGLLTQFDCADYLS